MASDPMSADDVLAGLEAENAKLMAFAKAAQAVIRSIFGATRETPEQFKALVKAYIDAGRVIEGEGPILRCQAGRDE